MNRSERDAQPTRGGTGTLLAIAPPFEALRAGDGDRAFDSVVASSRAKRYLDLAIVIVAAPAVLLVCGILAALIKVSSSGPILFRQKRVGADGVPFEMLKFRTMRTDSEAILRADPVLWATYVEHDFKLPCEVDPRLTGVGRWLRRWSLDEIPQFLNVLVGSMSMVGPRPVTPEQLNSWGSGGAAYLSVRPGLTGLWQINGRSGVKFDERVRYDESYIAGWTIWRDVRILALTPLTVLGRRGAH